MSCILAASDIWEEGLHILLCSEHRLGHTHILLPPAQVLIAQESMSRNQVYAFQKKQPHKYAYTAEVRSATETGMQPAQAVYVLLNARGSDKAGRTIESTLPYIRAVCASARNIIPYCIYISICLGPFQMLFACIVAYVKIRYVYVLGLYPLRSCTSVTSASVVCIFSVSMSREFHF